MDYLLLATFLYILVILLIISDEEVIEEKAEEQNDHVKIIAHRGAAGYAPENTFAAFDKAIELNADYIELDVQMSQDSELIVFHDASLKRITNEIEPLKQMDLSSLKKLDAGKWYHENYQNEQIPTLNEVLNRYQHKVGLLIELKDPENYPGIEKRLATLLKNKKLPGFKNDAIIVQSFNYQSIKRFSKLAPSIPTGLLMNFHPSELTDEKLKYFSAFINYINPPAFWIDQKLVQKIHQAGMKVFCWTVNDKHLFSQIKKMNVDGIITDFPDIHQKQMVNNKSMNTSPKAYSDIPLDHHDNSISGLLSSFLYFANTFLKELQAFTSEQAK